jgi:hypothetical protein
MVHVIIAAETRQVHGLGKVTFTPGITGLGTGIAIAIRMWSSFPGSTISEAFSFEFPSDELFSLFCKPTLFESARQTHGRPGPCRLKALTFPKARSSADDMATGSSKRFKRPVFALSTYGVFVACLTTEADWTCWLRKLGHEDTRSHVQTNVRSEPRAVYSNNS